MSFKGRRDRYRAGFFLPDGPAVFRINPKQIGSSAVMRILNQWIKQGFRVNRIFRNANEN
jgi:hypothetical protein